MGKGLKMYYAKKNNGSFYVAQIAKEDNGMLFCDGCDAKVQYVSGYMRKTTPVAPYLKLWQNEIHENNCKFSIDGSIQLLASESKAVEDLGKLIFEFEQDGSYIFRMNVLLDAKNEFQKMMDSQKDDQDLVLKKNINYLSNKKKLSHYFRSAAGIAKLRSLIEDSDDIELLKSKIKIFYKDKKIAWNDFYYDESRYHILFNRLIKKEITYPVAVNVVVKGNMQFYEQAKRFNYSYKCYSQLLKDKESSIRFIPTLQLTNKEIGENLLDKDRVIVIGDGWANKVFDSDNIFRNFNIGIYDKSQFMKENE